CIMTALGKGLRPLPAQTDVAILSDILSGGEQPAIEAAATLAPIFATAPYLRDLAVKHSQWFAAALQSEPGEAFAALIEDMRGAGRSDEEELSRRLRVGKARGALLSAVAEIGGVWSARETTRCMSDLADAALQAAIDFLMAEAAAEGKLALAPEKA